MLKFSRHLLHIVAGGFVGDRREAFIPFTLLGIKALLELEFN